MRGRQFGFIGLLCSTWVAARVFFLTISADATTQGVPKVTAILPAAVGKQELFRAEPSRADCCLYHAGHRIPFQIAVTSPRPAQLPHQTNTSQLVATAIGPQQTGSPTAPLPSFPTMLPPRAGANARKFPLEIYACSFWRSGNATPGQIGNGQYGGSQSAIVAGAGIWGGGQDDLFRVDAGPSLRADIATGRANFRLTADWRFRIAGKAEPGDGPAITLSTSF